MVHPNAGSIDCWAPKLRMKAASPIQSDSSFLSQAAAAWNHPWRLERFLPDLMHAGLLGSGKCLNGSVICHLVESGFWGPLGPGPYEDTMQEKLRRAYVSFKQWSKASGLQVVQPRFTPARIHRKSRATFPCMASKAVPGKVISFWLAQVASGWACRDGATHHDRVVWVCMWSWCSMLDQLSRLPLVLTPEQAQRVYDHGLLHLQSYAYLRQTSSLIRRGNGKHLFLMMPKHHHLHEMLRSMLKERVNPNVYSLLTAESFVGLIGKLTRNLGSQICTFNFKDR